MKKNNIVVVGLASAVVAGIVYFASASNTWVSELDKPGEKLSASERVTFNANQNITPITAVKPKNKSIIDRSPVLPTQVKFPLHTHLKKHAAVPDSADRPVLSAKHQPTTEETYNPQRDIVLMMPAGIGPLSDVGGAAQWSVVSPVAGAAESAQVRQALARGKRGFRRGQIKNISPYARFRKAQQTRL